MGTIEWHKMEAATNHCHSHLPWQTRIPLKLTFLKQSFFETTGNCFTPTNIKVEVLRMEEVALTESSTQNKGLHNLGAGFPEMPHKESSNSC